MSRYVSRDKLNRRVAYGFDHACGYFLQIYNPPEAEEELALDLDSLFGGLTNGRMLQVVENNGIELPEEHRRLIALDLHI